MEHLRRYTRKKGRVVLKTEDDHFYYTLVNNNGLSEKGMLSSSRCSLKGSTVIYS